MTRRAFYFTSPDHPGTLGVYFGLMILGLVTVAGLQDPMSIREVYGDAVVLLWGISRMAMGAIAGVAAILAARAMRADRSPGWPLFFEWIGCLLIFTMQSFYEKALFDRFGLTSTLETQVLTVMMALAGLVRLIQIPRQWCRYRKSVDRGATAETLADPDR